MAITLGSIELQEDMEWTDEFGWLPTAQQLEVAIGGNLIVEESKQLAGRPITLEGRMEGNVGFGMNTRAVVKALRALAAEPIDANDALLLTLDDGRVFDVMFRHHDGLAVEAKAMRNVAPYIDDDYYSLTLRLMAV